MIYIYMIIHYSSVSTVITPHLQCIDPPPTHFYPTWHWFLPLGIKPYTWQILDINPTWHWFLKSYYYSCHLCWIWRQHLIYTNFDNIYNYTYKFFPHVAFNIGCWDFCSHCYHYLINAIIAYINLNFFGNCINRLLACWLIYAILGTFQAWYRIALIREFIFQFNVTL